MISSARVQFGYSEKATKFEKIFHVKFDVTEQRQILSGRFFSSFVAFSEYPNFNNFDFLTFFHHFSICCKQVYKYLSFLFCFLLLLKIINREILLLWRLSNRNNRKNYQDSYKKEKEIREQFINLFQEISYKTHPLC